MDITAELFRLEEGTLVYFKRFFDNAENTPETEEDFNLVLRQFIYAAIMNNISLIFKLTDPITNKLFRNMNHARKEDNYITTELFTNKFIHRKPVDFESAPCIEKDQLLKLVNRQSVAGYISAKKFMKNVFDLLEEQDEYLHAVSYTDLLQVYKEIVAKEIRRELQTANSGSESNIYLKLLIEEARKGFTLKLNKYVSKKNFSKKDRTCIYYIVEDVISSYLNGADRESVKKLAERYYDGDSANTVRNKINYIIDLFNTEIISLIQREENNNVKELLEKNTDI